MNLIIHLPIEVNALIRLIYINSSGIYCMAMKGRFIYIKKENFHETLPFIH